MVSSMESGTIYGISGIILLMYHALCVWSLNYGIVRRYVPWPV